MANLVRVGGGSPKKKGMIMNPIWTSRTNPTGYEAFSCPVLMDNEDAYGAWRLYDGTSNPFVSAYNSSYPYIGIGFPEPVCCNNVFITNQAIGRPAGSCTVSASNDKNVWVPLATVTANSSEDITWQIPFDNTNKYKYYRIVFSSWSDTPYMYIAEIRWCYNNPITELLYDSGKKYVGIDTSNSYAITGGYSTNPSYVVEEADGITFRWGGQQTSSMIITEEPIDLTPYRIIALQSGSGIRNVDVSNIHSSAYIYVGKYMVNTYSYYHFGASPQKNSPYDNKYADTDFGRGQYEDWTLSRLWLEK